MKLRVSRAVLPAVAFAVVLIAHLAWCTRPLPPSPVQSRWATPPAVSRTAVERYVDAGDSWLGLSYAISVAFAIVAFRRYREESSCMSRNAAVGGLALSGIAATGGCFLAGCCGSPMLTVYVNVLGAGFLPFAKPFVAALTTLSCLGAWLWLEYRRPLARDRACGPDCVTD